MMEVTGTGRTEQAIHRMVVPHTIELNKMLREPFLMTTITLLHIIDS
jgi:hypothetical protein